MLILIGKSCAGKTTVLSKFYEEGYKCLEGSKIVREIQNEKGFKNILERCGDDIVATKIYKEFKKYKNCDMKIVISGLRTIAEVEYLKQYYSVFVVALYVSDEEAYRRSVYRNREQYDSFQDFYLNKICYDYSLGLAELYRRSDLFIQVENKPVEEIYKIIVSKYKNNININRGGFVI